MTIVGDGLVLGAGTVLAKMDGSAAPTAGLALDEAAEEHLLALLAAAYGRPVERRVLGNIRRALRYCRNGHQHLAAIELALSALPPLVGDEAAYRLYLADRLITGGAAPREVAKALGAGLALPDTARAGFNPNQPRVPSANPDGGQWDNGYSVTAAPAAARNPPAAPEYRTGDPDKFFDTLYPPVHALAQRLGIDETWLLGLSAYESGWLNAHNRALNDPFGATHHGGPNVAYSSLGDAVAPIGRRNTVLSFAARPAPQTSPSGYGRRDTIELIPIGGVGWPRPSNQSRDICRIGNRGEVSHESGGSVRRGCACDSSSTLLR